MVAVIQQPLFVPSEPLPLWTPRVVSAPARPMWQQVAELQEVLHWRIIPDHVCYLLCLDEPLLPSIPNPNWPDQHAEHYLGTTSGWRLVLRLWEHWSARGEGARFTQVARQRGITWELTRLWEGDREVEVWLKGGHRNYRWVCPRCTGDLAWGRGNPPGKGAR